MRGGFYLKGGREAYTGWFLEHWGVRNELMRYKLAGEGERPTEPSPADRGSLALRGGVDGGWEHHSTVWKTNKFTEPPYRFPIV